LYKKENGDNMDKYVQLQARRPEKKDCQGRRIEESAYAHLSGGFFLPVHEELRDTLLYTPPK
jgi:hypothetical protein